MSAKVIGAMRTFGHALAGVTGRSVQIDVHGTQAYTDGTRIVLPAEGLWSVGPHRARFGVAAHECAHVLFDSVPRMQRMIARYAAVEAGRVQRAFNAVIDVADETRFGRVLPGAEELFAEALNHSLRAGLAAGGPTLPVDQVPEEQLLPMGIMWVRAGPGSPARATLAPYFAGTPGLSEVADLLGRVVDRTSLRRFRTARTAREWRYIRHRVAELVRLLGKLYPNSYPPPLGAGADGPGGMMDESLPPWGRGQGAPGQPGDAPGQAPPARRPALPVGGIGPPSPLPGMFRGPKVGYRPDCYERVYPPFRRTVAALLTGPTLVREDGHRTGRRVGQPHRAATDGKCFRKTSWDDGPGYAVALVFDQSESMQPILPMFLPVGEALADALATDPATEVAIWRFGSWVEKVAKASDLRDGSIMGKTATHLAVRAAADWLTGHPARKRVLVIFTDGKPDEPPPTAEAVVRQRRAGTDVLVGSIGVNRQDCARSMPGAIVFDVDPQKADSSLHVALCRLRRKE